MPLFAKKRGAGVSSFMLKVINNHCSTLEELVEGPRSESRINLALAVLIIPVEGNKLLTDEAFTAITREFSTSGISVALDRPMGLDEVVLGLRWEGEMTFLRAEAKHLDPMGGGFYQLGLRLTEMVHPGDYPALETMFV